MDDYSKLTTDDINRRRAELASSLVYKHQNEGLIFYAPYPQQREFHSSLKPIRSLVGRNKGGKSYAHAVEMLLAVGQVHPYRPNKLKTQSGTPIKQVFGRSCCVDYRTLRETLMPIYRCLTPRKECKLPGKTFEGKDRIWPGLKGGNWDNAYNQSNDVLMLANGSEIEFMSYVQKREAFAGPVRHIIGHDEEPPEWIFGENVARQSTVTADLLFTLTPIDFSPWLYNLLCEQAIANDKVHTVYVRENEGPPLDETTKEILEELVTDEAERGARLRGEWTVLSGRVLKEYGQHNFIDPPIQWPNDWPRYVAIDPHEEKATAVVWAIFDRYSRTVYIYRELIMNGDVAEICGEIKRKSAGEQIEDVIIDISARKSATLRGQGSIIDLFEKHIPNLIEGTNHDKELARNRMKRLVRKQLDDLPRYFVTRDCPRTHNQNMNYSYKPVPRSGEDRQKAQIYKKNEDLVDCELYILQQLEYELEDGASVKQIGGGIGVYGNEFSIKSIGM